MNDSELQSDIKHQRLDFVLIGNVWFLSCCPVTSTDDFTTVLESVTVFILTFRLASYFSVEVKFTKKIFPFLPQPCVELPGGHIIEKRQSNLWIRFFFSVNSFQTKKYHWRQQKSLFNNLFVSTHYSSVQCLICYSIRISECVLSSGSAVCGSNLFCEVWTTQINPQLLQKINSLPDSVHYQSISNVWLNVMMDSVMKQNREIIST